MKDVILLWASFGVLIAAVFLYFSTRIPLLTHSRERSFLATITSVLTLTTVTATLLLPALDIALVSSTNIPILGVRKEAATDAKVDAIVLWIKIAYVGLLALTAFLTFFATPFAWIYFEEWDEDSTGASRAATATKYTAVLLGTIVLLFVLGLVIPSSSSIPDRSKGIDFDYLKQLIAASRVIKALLFVLGILTCAGTLTEIYYTGTGLSTLPLTLLKTKSAKDLDAEAGDNAVDLDLNRQKQRQLELKYDGSRTPWSPKDRRTFESLQRRERALIRSRRLKAEGRSRLLERLSLPLKISSGLVFLVLSLLTIVTLSIALIRQLLRDDSCGSRCDFLKALPSSILLNPMELSLSKLPYYGSFILHLLVLLFLTAATFNGLQTLGIRFLWVKLFHISQNATVPQSLLSMSILMATAAFGISYSSTTFLVPGYVQYGTQTFCNGTLSECAEDSALVRSCTLVTNESDTGCTRSVVSRILASMVVNFPGFSFVLKYAQFAIIVVFIGSLVVSVFKKNLGATNVYDEDEEGEDEVSTERSRLL